MFLNNNRGSQREHKNIEDSISNLSFEKKNVIYEKFLVTFCHIKSSYSIAINDKIVSVTSRNAVNCCQNGWCLNVGLTLYLPSDSPKALVYLRKFFALHKKDWWSYCKRKCSVPVVHKTLGVFSFMLFLK